MNLHRLVLGQLCTNCYVIADENTKEAVVVDAPDNADEIIGHLEEKGYSLKEIVLTHGHFDHILALRELKEKTKAKISIHENGKIFLADETHNLARYVGLRWEPIMPDRLLKEGDKITFGENSLDVLHTPGHTSDCICLLADDFVLSGDTLFRFSVGRVDHPTGDLEQEVASIKEKLMPLSDDMLVYPGHGGCTTIGEERRGNPYLR